MGCKVLCPSVALLAYLIICQHVRAQCTQPSFASRNVILTAEHLSTQRFPDGSTVTFECVIGHRPADLKASKSVTCQGNQWTNLELSCTRKSCGSLADFLHGRYEMTGNLFGDTAKPFCDKGHMLAGQETTRTCRDKGWDGRDPVCEPVKCSAPPGIENGQLEDEPLESYDYLQAVSYRCNKEFNIIGQSTLSCSEDGTFKPDPPKCFDGCPVPTIPNAKRIGGKSPPYKLGNFIKYKCEDGYTMKGIDEIVCRANGWSPEPLRCIGPCPLPELSKHVTSEEFRSHRSFPHGTSVTLECIRGYEPVDATVSKTITCEETKWTKSLLTCKAQCTQPSFASRNVILTAEHLSTQRFPDGSTVTFECVIGHRPADLKASKSVTCQGNQWTNLELSCTRKSCGSLADFLHGRYEMTGNLFGDTAKPFCNKGHMLAGQETTRTCRDKGWDGRDPVCEPVKCSAPPGIENGQLEDEPLESYGYSQAVSYRCNKEFNIIGQSTLSCSEDGTFKPDPPKCFDGCPVPTIPNAKRIGGKSPPYKLGNFIKYKCEDGYTMKGSDEIVCRENGWSPEPLRCIEDTTNENTKDTTEKSMPTWAEAVLGVGGVGAGIGALVFVYFKYFKKRSEHEKVGKKDEDEL